MKGPNKIQNVLTLKQSYEYYIKDLSEESKYYIDYKLYRKICEEANKILTIDIVNGYVFQLPYRLGVIRVKKRKVDYKNLKPDFGLFNQSEGELKNKHLNEHTAGYYCKFHWNKLNCIVKNRTAYCFIPTRTNKRFLASELKTRGKELINSLYE